jgi:hypothetical protein
LQFGAKIQHPEAFVNSFNPFFDTGGTLWASRTPLPHATLPIITVGKFNGLY